MNTSSVCQCNGIFNEETLHPLISVIELSQPASKEGNRPIDCYAAILVTSHTDNGCYGHTPVDYTDATMTFRLPGGTIEDIEGSQGSMLLFHPDLIRFTCLSQDIKDCNFFSYTRCEALHLSACEKRKIECCLESINDELRWGVDKFTKALLCNKIELLLNYVHRFYYRQFILRHEINASHLNHVRSYIDQYFLTGKASSGHMPQPRSIAKELNMSEAYMGDIVRHETGASLSEYINQRRMALAKTLLISGNRNEQDIAALLGFCTPSCFRLLFKKLTGCEPEDYR